LIIIRIAHHPHRASSSASRSIKHGAWVGDVVTV
jgi:hypothetical protein